MLSSQSIAAISDLIENRLAAMAVADQDDLREKLTLQHALIEIHGDDGVPAGMLHSFADIPRRGRRRKIGNMAS